MSSNDGRGKPDAGRDSGSSRAETDMPRLLLSVPDLRNAKAETAPITDQVVAETQAAPSVRSDNTPVASPGKWSFLKDVPQKTALLAEMFAKNKRTFGTLGTIAAAIFVCTLVARAMKQDHPVAGSISELAFRDPPSSTEVEVKPDEPGAIVETAPDFDPAMLLAHDGQPTGPSPISTQQQPNRSGPFAPVQFEQNSAKSVALGSGGGEFPAVPGEAPEFDMRGSSFHPANASPYPQPPRFNPPRPETIAESRWSDPSRDFNQSRFGQAATQSEQATAAMSAPRPNATASYAAPREFGQTPPQADQATQVVAVDPADAWPRFEQERQSSAASRTASGGYGNEFQASPANSPPPATGTMGQLAAEPQTSPRYPSTSKTAYPSFQEYKAGLERQQQLRLGDRRASAMGSGVPYKSPGEIR